jgi:hydrogenase expression/formation protein HypC
MCLAVPGQIVAIAGEGLTRMARVSFGGIEKDVSLAFVPGAQVRDYVLVHAGVALSRLDERAAEEVFEMLAEMAALDPERQNGAGGSA